MARKLPLAYPVSTRFVLRTTPRRTTTQLGGSERPQWPRPGPSGAQSLWKPRLNRSKLSEQRFYGPSPLTLFAPVKCVSLASANGCWAPGQTWPVDCMKQNLKKRGTDPSTMPASIQLDNLWALIQFQSILTARTALQSVCGIERVLFLSPMAKERIGTVIQNGYLEYPAEIWCKLILGLNIIPDECFRNPAGNNRRLILCGLPHQSTTS